MFASDSQTQGGLKIDAKAKSPLDVSRSSRKRGGAVSRADVSGRRIVKMKHGRGSAGHS